MHAVVRPEVDEYLPASQGKQDEASEVKEYWPARQAAHDEALASE